MCHLPTWLCGFDIDYYLNPFIPPSPLSKLPKPVSWFLGHRESPPKHVCAPLTWFWSLLGGFCGVALIEAVYKYGSDIQDLHPPVVIGSFGAAAILEYNAIESPLAQPRPAILSQVISAAIGVGITKLFALLPHARFEDTRWLAGALAVGISSATMSITKTVHPPAGATALLAATSPDVTLLGWWLLPLVLLGAVLMVTSACVINNIQRRFPIFWWTPVDLRKMRVERKETDIEKATTKESQQGPRPPVTRSSLQEADSHPNTETSEITISASGVIVPVSLDLDAGERSLLEILRIKLAESTTDASSSGSMSEEEENKAGTEHNF